MSLSKSIIALFTILSLNSNFNFQFYLKAVLISKYTDINILSSVTETGY